MSRLSGLGPRKKVFEDLTPGDYLFEIQAPGENGWTRRFTMSDEEFNEIKDHYPELKKKSSSDVWMDFVNFKLVVLEPKEFAGKVHFHSLMFDASEAKIALAKKTYDPSTFLFQFLGDIGAGMKENGEIIILDDYLTDGDIDLDKLIGLQFNASARMVKNRKDPSKERVQITTCWPE
jgi:hypothetical protein